MDISSSQLRWILVSTVLASSMVFIDASVANIILSKIQSEYHTDLSQLQWVIQAYGLTLSSFLLFGGALGDHLGRKRVFLIGLILFLFSSIACGVSHNIWQLILSRALQGVGGALLTPQSLAIINSTFPDSLRSKAVGSWSSASAFMAVIGPALGGWISDNYGWRVVFLINIPLALTAGVFAWKYILDDHQKIHIWTIDLKGTFLGVVGIACWVYGISIKDLYWTGVGTCILIFFWLYERKIESPILPLKVFRSKQFSLINLITILLYAALGMAFFYLPIHLIQVLNYTAAQAGMATSPFALLIGLLSRTVGSLTNSVKTQVLLSSGSFLTSIGFGWLAFMKPSDSYLVGLLPGLIVGGVGMALTITPLTAAALGSLEDTLSGLASGINNTAARLAGLIGVSLAVLIVTQSYQKSLTKQMNADVSPYLYFTFENSDKSPEDEKLRHAIIIARWRSYYVLMLSVASICLFSGCLGTQIKNKT